MVSKDRCFGGCPSGARLKSWGALWVPPLLLRLRFPPDLHSEVGFLTRWEHLSYIFPQGLSVIGLGVRQSLGQVTGFLRRLFVPWVALDSVGPGWRGAQGPRVWLSLWASAQGLVTNLWALPGSVQHQLTMWCQVGGPEFSSHNSDLWEPLALHCPSGSLGFCPLMSSGVPQSV